VWHDRSLIFWTRLIAVTFVTTGQLLHADDPPASSDGYKTVPVTVGGKTLSIRVVEPRNPFRNVSSSSSTGKYDPSSLNFSATSPMANKTFSPSSDSISKSNSIFKNRDQDTFITKPYADDASSPSAPNLNTKGGFPPTGGYNRTPPGFDKSYSTSNADAGLTRTAALASVTSTDQGRTATLGPQTASTPASSFAGKTFQGSEADAARHHLTKLDNGQMLITDLPNRPLTIDEVRELINHGFKPNTDVKPGEPSKPLNDPNYKPEPLRDMPAPTGDDDKNDPVPAPGTMAAPHPENSEPLPQP
jgi:hypothetical protein